jgi:hypothetical protein
MVTAVPGKGPGAAPQVEAAERRKNTGYMNNNTSCLTHCDAYVPIHQPQAACRSSLKLH